MNKKSLTTIGSVAAFVVVASGITWAAVGIPQGGTPVPTETPAAVSVFEINGFADAPPKATPTPEPSPVVVEEPAPEAPSGPVLCPPGSTANSSDGVNDTSCYPDVCFTISVPNPDYPECDYAFEP